MDQGEGGGGNATSERRGGGGRRGELKEGEGGQGYGGGARIFLDVQSKGWMNGRWGGTGIGEEDGEKNSESEVKNTFQKVFPKTL